MTDNEALVEEWEQKLTAEGMPAEPRRKLRRGSQIRYGAKRPWLGPYEFPAAAVGNGHSNLDLDPSVGRTVYVDGNERPATMYEALMVAPHQPIDISTEELQPLRETLTRYIGRLRAKPRRIIEMTVMGNSTISETAAALKMRRSTVWAVQQRTLKELSRKLEKQREVQKYLARHLETHE